MRKIIGLILATSFSHYIYAADAMCKGFDPSTSGNTRASNLNITQSFNMNYNGSKPYPVSVVVNGGQGTSFHHIIPYGAFITQLNLVLDKSTDASKRDNVLNSLAKEIAQVQFQTATLNKNALYNLIDQLKSTAASGTKIIIDKNSPSFCGVTQNNLWEFLLDIVAYNPADGYNGPDPLERTWDPNGKFDTWGQYFVNKTAYDNLVRLNTEKDVSKNAQYFIQIFSQTTGMPLMTFGNNSNWVAINNVTKERFQPRKLQAVGNSAKNFW